MHTILIIEDDAAMLRGLKDNFEFEGYKVLTATDGDAGLKMALSAQPDLILLDLMLPKINGYEVCRFLREEKCEVPILMLTAKSQESDVVLGLKLGADDYITKPFGIREVLARCEAFLRRRGAAEPEVFEFGKCRLDCAARLFSREGAEVALSPKEFALLEYFCRKQGRALTREQILRDVWGYDRLVTARSIDRFVATLRAKIEPVPEHPRHLLTVREIGYRFVAEDE